MRLAWLMIVLVASGAVGVLAVGTQVGGPAPPTTPATDASAAIRASDGPSGPGAPTPSPPGPGAPTPSPQPTPDGAGGAPVPVTTPRVAWRRSQAVGLPNAGSLLRGVQLPAEGRHYFTWDPVTKTVPNRGWRRWGTDRLVRVVLSTLRRYREANPQAPRVGIGDLSRPRGGDFGARFGNLGHSSHQNGLDVDLYYPRDDRRERRPHHPALVDPELSQDLVDAFVAAGATFVFVGPRLDLDGPPDVVQPLVHHDDHLHVRIR